MFDLVQPYDHAILLWLQENFRNAVLNPFMVFYTKLGNGGFLVLAVLAILMIRKETRRYALAGLSGLVISYAAIHLIKITVMRPRPFVTYAGELIPLTTIDDPNSFPSGHAGSCFSSATAWTKALPSGKKLPGIIALCLAGLMAFSRLYVCVHYPSDVAVGILIGILGGLAGAFLYLRGEKYWLDKKKKTAES